MAEGYRGVVGAFPYAFRHSESWLLRSYVLVSALVAGVVSLLVVFGLIQLIARTAVATGGTLTLSRTFYVVVGLFVVLPIVAPTLLVARRHRRETPVREWYDPGLAASGYLFVVALYVGLVVTVPPEQQTPPTGALGPLVQALYDLPAVVGIVPPVLAAALILALARLGRNPEK